LPRADLAADLTRHLAERLQEAQREALRAGRPAPARLSADTPLLVVSRDALRVLDLDLVAAGLARRVRGRDRQGKPSWKIDKRDERGRTFDMHAFRTTFNSLLAAAGVPLTTRRILMRHAAESVTDEHYADATLIDLRGALDRLPPLPVDGTPERQAQAATGTGDRTAGRMFGFCLAAYNPDSCSAIQCDSARVNDASTDRASEPAAICGSPKTLSTQEQSDAMRRGAEGGRKAGDGIRTHDVQLGKQFPPCASGEERVAYRNASNNPACSSDSCAVTTLHDDELRCVAAAWPALPEPIRRAVMALVGSVVSNTTTKTPAGATGTGVFVVASRGHQR